MPLHKGHSPEVVRSNIKEMIRSGYKPKQAIAASLSSARKYRKMAQGGATDDRGETLGHKIGYPGYSDGGQVVEDGGMGDIPRWQMPKGGDDEPMSKMDEKGPEDDQRDLLTLDREANYNPSEVANPNEQDEDMIFAKALRRRAMSMLSPENPEGEGYAEGGLVQGDTEEDFPLGAVPEPKMGPENEDEEVRADVGTPFMKEPSGSGLSKEAIEALKKKKMMRRYSQ